MRLFRAAIQERRVCGTKITKPVIGRALGAGSSDNAVGRAMNGADCAL